MRVVYDVLALKQKVDSYNGRCGSCILAVVPPLRGRRAADDAKEKTGRSGRDDRVGKCKSKREGPFGRTQGKRDPPYNGGKKKEAA